LLEKVRLLEARIAQVERELTGAEVPQSGHWWISAFSLKQAIPLPVTVIDRHAKADQSQQRSHACTSNLGTCGGLRHSFKTAHRCNPAWMLERG